MLSTHRETLALQKIQGAKYLSQAEIAELRGNDHNHFKENFMSGKELLQAMREAYGNAPEIKDFIHKIGDQEFVVPIKKLAPGTVGRLREAALIRLYTQTKVEHKLQSIDDKTADVTEDELAELLEENKAARAETIAKRNETFIKIAVDRETKKPYMTVEEAEELFPATFKEDCIQWAMSEVTAQDPDDLDEVAEFQQRAADKEKDDVA